MEGGIAGRALALRLNEIESLSGNSWQESKIEAPRGLNARIARRYLPTGRQPSLGTAANGGGSVGSGCIGAAGSSIPSGKNTGRVGTG